MTEALLLTMPLMMLVAALLQIFLVDEYTFRLASRAHHQLFTQVAFPDNRPTVEYETRYTSRWNGREQYVPVIGFFRPYGLTADQMRIRSVRVPPPPGGDKRIKLGRGTRPSVAAGLAGVADPSAWLGAANDAMSRLTRANQMRLEMEAQRDRGRR